MTATREDRDKNLNTLKRLLITSAFRVTLKVQLRTVTAQETHVNSLDDFTSRRVSGTRALSTFAANKLQYAE